jgi:hypothetical protein
MYQVDHPVALTSNVVREDVYIFHGGLAVRHDNLGMHA